VKTIQQLLDQKGSQVWSIEPEASVLDAMALMAEKNVGALLVIDPIGPVGLVSERDFARNLELRGKAARDTPVREVMTRPVVCAAPDQTIEEAMALMTDKRVRHLPVLDDGQVLGLVSIGDLVHATIAEQRFLIEQLEHYISA
jgi:CBS domain-containing protein